MVEPPEDYVERPPAPTDDPLDPAPQDALVGRLATLIRHPSFRRRLLAPMSFDVLILTTNLFTGIVVARALGPSGRGELAATLLVTQIAAWLFAFGANEAIAYGQSVRPQEGGRLASSWLFFSLPVAVIAVGIGEIFLPVLFSAQSQHAIDLARLYLATIPVIALQGIFGGLLIGDENFRWFNITRLVPFLLAAIGYAGMWASGIFTVELALLVNAVGGIVAVIVMASIALQRHRLTRPDWSLLRTSLWYGTRAHAGSAASIVNARLDLLIIPAFLTAADIGFYSVATNVSSILPTLTATIGLMVLPVAARRTGSARTVLLTMQAAMGIAIFIAIPLAILAPFALGLVYGADFKSAAEPLRILLPGSIFQAGVEVLWSGLLAANRPFLASVAVAPPAVITIAGLVVFLPVAGINAAAIITSVAYATEFVLMAIFYRRTLKISWKAFLRAPAT